MVKVSSGRDAPFARGFPPVASRDARVLILGSLPGEKSIEMQQYYAQHRNAFWRILGELCGAGPQLPYAARLRKLRACGIALWDVLAAGERRGSLDSAIVTSTIEVNDFHSFFALHRGIRLVCFNGRKAADLYRRYVLPTLPSAAAELDARLLPSTSPAHAARSFEQKLALWAEALRGHIGGRVD
ncbi:MAG: DNA-deoxyinosine glycosylase [Gammaproteobacteria bacterium]|nr:DNA-deoxyinosine glycosylase [Gammaproteobacteria bacterium]